MLERRPLPFWMCMPPLMTWTACVCALYIVGVDVALAMRGRHWAGVALPQAAGIVAAMLAIGLTVYSLAMWTVFAARALAFPKADAATGGALTAVFAVIALLALRWNANGTIQLTDAVLAAPLLALGLFVYLLARWSDRRTETLMATITTAMAVTFFLLPLIEPLLRPPPDVPTRPLPPETPSLLLITADALRADRLAVNGGPVPTPGLERMAETGANFTRGYALAPWTMPSLYGLFASQHPANGRRVHPAARRWYLPPRPTLSELATDQGFATAAFTGNHLVSIKFGQTGGFSHHEAYRFDRPGLRGPLAATPLFHALMELVLPNHIRQRPLDSTRILHHRAKTFLRQHRDKPFFLWLHFMDPHDPYDPPPRFRNSGNPSQADPASKGLARRDGAPPQGRMGDVLPHPPSDTSDRRWPTAHTPWFAPTLPQWGGPQHDNQQLDLTREQRAHVQTLYDGEIQYLDEAIGRILDELEALDRADDTYVAFTADHGEELWDHGNWGHGHTLYEELIRVPLILRGPTVEPQTIDTPVSAIDLMPTFADWLRIDPPDHWQGESWAAALAAGQPPESQHVFANANGPEPEVDLRAVVEGAHKLIATDRDTPQGPYDLAADPNETTDRREQSPEAFTRLLEALTQWRPGAPSPDTEPVDPELYEQLRAVGYVD